MDNNLIKILLLEDNDADADLLIEILTETNKKMWHITHIDRLQRAINELSKHPFDVILLDLSLPDSQGLETVIQLQEGIINIPIIVLTGLDNQEIALQSLAKGAQDYLVKGRITKELLQRTIHYAIERQKNLQALQDNEHRFRGIFEQTFQLMQLLTPTGIILKINQTALNFSGNQLNDLVGKYLWEIPFWNYTPNSQEYLKLAVSQAEKGNFFREEFEVCTNNNISMWIDFSIKPLKNERGNVILLIGEGRDITDHKRAEAEMIKALEKERDLNQLKSKFISMVSHEFRNPLTVIKGAATMLQTISSQLTVDRKNRLFELIQSAINRQIKLLDEILLLGRGDSGKIHYNPISLDLELFLLKLIQSLEITDGGNHNIIFVPPQQYIMVEMDEVLLQHIFNNLLSNALKYSPDGSEIKFELIYQDDKAIFQIQDHGIGIPVEDQEHLFETFYRSSNVGKIQGTGLGLSIVKQCVDLHGGQIYVESTVNVGTIFTVILPLNAVNC